MMNKRLLKLVIAGALVAPTAALAAFTQTATGSLTVSASVTATCTVGTSAIDFLAVDPFATTDLTATGAVKVTCTNGTAYSIGLDKGANGADVSNRQMANGTAMMNYALYTDDAHANNWGNTDGTDTLTGLTGSGTEQSNPVYGVVPKGQNALKAGSYSDTVVVTVNY